MENRAQAATIAGATGISRRGKVVRALLAVAVIAGLVLLARGAGGSLSEFATWVDGLGFWGPLVFVAGYAVATVAFVPG
ncbi:MAG TPA: hypothetical protein VMV46_01840, partial [Thermoanaerobaculia bacterium]|nr:hypothetical protein [Thermoanaerobaculia bacterium]